MLHQVHGTGVAKQCILRVFFHVHLFIKVCLCIPGNPYSKRQKLLHLRLIYSAVLSEQFLLIHLEQKISDVFLIRHSEDCRIRILIQIRFKAFHRVQCFLYLLIPVYYRD